MTKLDDKTTCEILYVLGGLVVGDSLAPARERIEALILAERERCAKLADDSDAACECAARIRAAGPQIAVVLKNGQWFIRRIAYTVRDDAAGEMVYHCDEHLGGPFAGWRDMANAVDAYLLKTT